MDRRRAVRPAASSNGRAEPAAFLARASRSEAVTLLTAARKAIFQATMPRPRACGRERQRRDDGTLCKRVVGCTNARPRTSRLPRRSMFFNRQTIASGRGDPRRSSATFRIVRQRHGHASVSRRHVPHDRSRANMLSSPMPGRAGRLASVGFTATRAATSRRQHARRYMAAGSTTC